MKKWCDKLRSNSEGLYRINMLLNKYACAFKTVGNMDMYDKLSCIQSQIAEISRDVEKCRSSIINDSCKEAQERSAMILKAALIKNNRE